MDKVPGTSKRLRTSRSTSIVGACFNQEVGGNVSMNLTAHVKQPMRFGPVSIEWEQRSKGCRKQETLQLNLSCPLGAWRQMEATPPQS